MNPLGTSDALEAGTRQDRDMTNFPSQDRGETLHKHIHDTVLEAL